MVVFLAEYAPDFVFGCNLCAVTGVAMFAVEIAFIAHVNV
jgi:hypothetical protein